MFLSVIFPAKVKYLFNTFGKYPAFFISSQIYYKTYIIDFLNYYKFQITVFNNFSLPEINMFNNLKKGLIFKPQFLFQNFVIYKFGFYLDIKNFDENLI